MQPMLQMSMGLAQRSWPRSSSGAQYQRVTTTGVNYLLGLYSLARPKSHTLRVPWLLQSRLLGLRSQWRMLRLCRYSTPINNYCNNDFTSAQQNLCCTLFSSKCFNSCSIYSITTYTLSTLFPDNISLIVTMFLCFSPSNKLISLIVVIGNPSFNSFCIFTFLMANTSPVILSLALNTIPYTPS